jgi:hypothetical protein
MLKSNNPTQDSTLTRYIILDEISHVSRNGIPTGVRVLRYLASHCGKNLCYGYRVFEFRRNYVALSVTSYYYEGLKI